MKYVKVIKTTYTDNTPDNHSESSAVSESDGGPAYCRPYKRIDSEKGWCDYKPSPAFLQARAQLQDQFQKTERTMYFSLLQP